MATEHTVGFEPADRLAKDRESVRRRFWFKLKRVVGSAKATISGTLSVKLTIRFTKPARKALARLKSVSLSARLFLPSAGAAPLVTKKVTLRR